jgi:hypothetical protein
MTGFRLRGCRGWAGAALLFWGRFAGLLLIIVVKCCQQIDISEDSPATPTLGLPEVPRLTAPVPPVHRIWTKNLEFGWSLTINSGQHQTWYTSASKLAHHEDTYMRTRITKTLLLWTLLHLLPC